MNNISVNPNKVEELSRVFRDFSRTIETNEDSLYIYIKKMLNEVKREYPERNVRKEVEEMEGLLEEIRKDAIEINQWYRDSSRNLNYLAGQLRYEEEQIASKLEMKGPQVGLRNKDVVFFNGLVGLGKYEEKKHRNRNPLGIDINGSNIEPTILQYTYIKTINQWRAINQPINHMELIEEVEKTALEEQKRIESLTEMELISEMERMKGEIIKWLKEEKGGKWTRSIHKTEVKSQRKLENLVSAGKVFVDISGTIYFNKTVTKEEKLVLFSDFEAKLYEHSLDRNWETLLKKDSSELTSQDYMILALIFIELDIEDMEHFLNLCLANDGEIMHYDLRTNYRGLTYTWDIKREKVRNINACMEAIVVSEYFRDLANYNQDTSKENYFNEVTEKRKILIQKSALLIAFDDIGAFNSKTVNDGPIIELSKENYNIKMEYYSMGNKPYSENDSMKKSKVITRGYLAEEESIKLAGIKTEDFNLNYSQYAKYNPYSKVSIEENKKGMILSGIESGYNATKQIILNKDMPSNQYTIPVEIVYNIATNIMEEHKKTQQEIKTFDKEINTLTRSICSNTFQLMTVFAYGDDGKTAQIYPSIYTQERIDWYNVKIGKVIGGITKEEDKEKIRKFGNMDIDKVLNEQEKVYEILSILSENNVYDEIFSDNN
ncbi:hypothetical protein EDC19_1494 [Natranaerovirga hydrolytica]|uniref:Uncharacterized protein n=1 Tax=Natranaerovirga hydrolytica TaxID=680378 RepID=A0A4R1MTK7_9FIRM|nr:hypothetical protein [Natranaerovirga hydrolytica]TCK93303.1 hypothetical protein EDC19_1494 [Natranaerovirga hydrolytica]